MHGVKGDASNELKNGTNTRHRALMRELLGGATNTQAAARCGFTVQRVIQLKNSELFMNELNRMEGELDGKVIEGIADDTASVSDMIRDAAPASAEKLISLRDNAKSEQVQAKSAMELLDRGGYKAPQEVVANVSLDVDEGLKHMLSCMLQDKVVKEKEKDGSVEDKE